MSETAARLQSHNQEMVKCLNQLRSQQTALEERISQQENRKNTLNKELEKMQRALEQVEASIAEDTKKLNECSKRLTETEHGYTKVVDTLQLLLMSAKEGKTSLISETNAKHESKQ
uniref:Sjoegren syndrome nuclear autoantigen 1 n=1 Tax=Anopheles farauti TaxID=69004 RepID=A0A182QSJ0_9DIPT